MPCVRKYGLRKASWAKSIANLTSSDQNSVNQAMKGVLVVLGGFALMVFGAALWCMGTYNGLVARQAAVNASWAQADKTRQRREELDLLLAAAKKRPGARAELSHLQAELKATENRLSMERRSFNEFAAAYNVAIRRMPDALVARLAGFEERPYFQAEDNAQKAPAVRF